MKQLYQYQQEILDKSREKYQYALFMETGTGKTIVTIENIRYLWYQKLINFCIILAPKMVIEAVWEYELTEYSQVMPYRLFKWVGGISDTDKMIIRDVAQVIKNKSYEIRALPILLVNIEAFSHTKIYQLINELLQATNSIMIIDESTTIKNIRAQRTKGLLKISHLAKYKRILTGFPILRSPEDLYSQIRFLSPNIIPYASFYAFRNEFCILRNMGRYQIVIQHKNLDRLSQLIEPFSTRVLKKNCLDLPEKVRTKRYVEMTIDQKLLYDSMKKQGFIELKNAEKENQRVFATSLLVQIGKLHQIANGLLVQQKGYIANHKYDVLVDILENEITDQCVMWFHFTDSLRRAAEVIGKKFGSDSYTIIYGDVQHHERINNLQAFQTKQKRFLLANPSTAMHGLNLTCCSDTIYVNNSPNLEHRIQSEDRFHRIGQVNKVTYRDLITHGTVEDKILQTLQDHHHLGAEVLKDEWEEWFH